MHGPLNVRFLNMTLYDTNHVALTGISNNKKLGFIAIYLQLCRRSCYVAITGAIYMKIYFK
jgi:hypothetical protein